MQNRTIKPLASQKIAVMIVDDHPARAAILERALLDSGYRITNKLSSTSQLTQSIHLDKPDIIIIDVESPSRDMLENMAQLGKNLPPIVMFTEQEVPLTLQRAIDAGVSLYVVSNVQSTLVQSIIEVAIARYREYQALRTELEQTQHELADRKLIEKAKLLLIQKKGCSEEAAYQILRKLAMDKSTRMSLIAQNIIDISHILETNSNEPT